MRGLDAPSEYRGDEPLFDRLPVEVVSKTQAQISRAKESTCHRLLGKVHSFGFRFRIFDFLGLRCEDLG